MEFGRVGRVVVADDEPVVRRGLRTSVESTGAFHVVAEAADGHEAVEAVRAHLPDILLLDIHMPRMDGLEATAALRAPDSGAAAHIVVTTGLGLDADVERALALGADAFLPKDAPREELLAALRAVQEGDAALSPPVLRSVLDGLRTPAAAQRRRRGAAGGPFGAGGRGTGPGRRGAGEPGDRRAAAVDAGRGEGPGRPDAGRAGRREPASARPPGPYRRPGGEGPPR